MPLVRLLQVLDGLLPALDGGLDEAHLDGRLSTGEVPGCLVPADHASPCLETVLVEVLSRKIEDGALPQECLDGGFIIGKGPHVLLPCLTWEVLKVHVVLLLGDGGSDEEAGVIGVDGALWELFNVDGEVREDLVQLVPCDVRCVSIGDHALEASCTKSDLHVRPLLVKVSGDYELAARQLR